ncbi:rRNA maturation RNase YbeY [Aliifodinibius salipaludis]|uniref:Endoribonuclease YbeY n=1 Tax=Fodinibius salipaludis TaxID=2032627 RepID=A0A2A2GCX6_9BACT|nr:rRNA maturation RNase YbeY [Aliifodinibius salipaludis]PAU95506.1 rRNA maturation RNase YbeY [Aliifodinibius salipaludis]
MADEFPDIQVFNQTSLSIPLEQPFYQAVAKQLSDEEKCSFNFVEVVYVDEEKIVQINSEHLNRDYITDIITFRYDDTNHNHDIEGTMFCCGPRIVEQAQEFNESNKREFLRIYIHGLLHLAGYEDQSEKEKEQMSQKEEFYLNLAEKQYG